MCENIFFRIKGILDFHYKHDRAKASSRAFYMLTTFYTCSSRPRHSGHLTHMCISCMLFVFVDGFWVFFKCCYLLCFFLNVSDMGEQDQISLLGRAISETGTREPVDDDCIDSRCTAGQDQRQPETQTCVVGFTSPSPDCWPLFLSF